MYLLLLGQIKSKFKLINYSKVIKYIIVFTIVYRKSQNLNSLFLLNNIVMDIVKEGLVMTGRIEGLLQGLETLTNKLPSVANQVDSMSQRTSQLANNMQVNKIIVQ